MPFHGLIGHFLLTPNNVHYVDVPISPTKGYLGCFQALAVMNNAAVNIHVQVFVCT